MGRAISPRAGTSCWVEDRRSTRSVLVSASANINGMLCRSIISDDRKMGRKRPNLTQECWPDCYKSERFDSIQLIVLPMKRRKIAKTRDDDRQHSKLSVPMPPHRMANEHDNSVVEQLASALLGTLKVDHFAKLLRGKPMFGIVKVTRAFLPLLKRALRGQSSRRAFRQRRASLHGGALRRRAPGRCRDLLR
jgi:hypothetical protein